MRELFLQRDRSDHAEVVAALLDRGDVDGQVLTHSVCSDGVTRLVHRYGVALALDVLRASSGGPRLFSNLARITSCQVIVSRPARMALINASLTRSLMLAPVA